MRHLVIAAHPRAGSFNRSIIDAYAATLAERGHRVQRRDLYALGFNPILSARDLAAMARGRPARDVRTELDAIRAADAITLIAPLWWGGFPAMLKGYADRVFTAACSDLVIGKDRGAGFPGRKGAIIMTSEASVAELRSSGVLRALKITYGEGLMGYCGIELVGQLHLGGIGPAMSRAEGERHLETVRRFARRMFPGASAGDGPAIPAWITPRPIPGGPAGSGHSRRRRRQDARAAGRR